MTTQEARNWREQEAQDTRQLIMAELVMQHAARCLDAAPAGEPALTTERRFHAAYAIYHQAFRARYGVA